MNGAFWMENFNYLFGQVNIRLQDNKSSGFHGQSVLLEGELLAGRFANWGIFE